MLDHVEIVAFGGSGGAGKVSFRRSKRLPRGGPDGGDGGRGGSVILECSEDVLTLTGLAGGKGYRAEDGEPGGPARRHGRDGRDTVLRVPLGTVVTRQGRGREGEVVAELLDRGARVIVASGGRGGRGNARLATAVNQAPRIAERGQRGEESRVILDLKMLSDVGIVGLPNAGKSTLLRAVTEARPKVGQYAFTTLEPEIGVMEVGFEPIVVLEIPGLVEGAQSGAGLGLDFLRHVERTRVVVHLLDGSRGDPEADVEALNREMEEFGHGLPAKRQLVVVNKVDLPEVRPRRGELGKALRRQTGEAWFISAATGEGVQELVKAIGRAVGEEREREPALAREVTMLRPPPSVRFTVRKVENTFVVEGEQAVALVEMMGIDSDEARAAVLRRLRRMGVTGALRRAGARAGDRVRFGEVEMEWEG